MQELIPNPIYGHYNNKIEETGGGAHVTLSHNRGLVEPLINADSNKNLDSLLSPHNIVNRYRVNWFNNFSRTGFIDPYNNPNHTKEYLFFTRPDLHLYSGEGINKELSSSPFFIDAIDRYTYQARMLQISSPGGNLIPFVPMLSNAVNGALELPGISADYIETARNVYGTAMHYRGSSFKSDQDFDFSLDFKDDKFLDVYMYFKMYDEYERMKWLGQVSPPSDEYVINKILHDQTSIYKFIVAEDGMTILYYARVVGVFPTSVPRDSMSNIEKEITYSVSFHGKFIQDMDPIILKDFNRISQSYANHWGDLPLWDRSNNEFNGKWAKCPRIYIRNEQNTDDKKRNKYYLIWKG